MRIDSVHHGVHLPPLKKSFHEIAHHSAAACHRHGFRLRQCPARLSSSCPRGLAAAPTAASAYWRRWVSKAGLPVIVENKAGASGSIAGHFVAKSRPDSLTVLVGTSGALVTNTLLFEKFPYDPLMDGLRAHECRECSASTAGPARS